METGFGHAQVFDLIQKMSVALFRVEIDDHVDLDLIDERRVVLVGALDGTQHVAAVLDVRDLAHQDLAREVHVIALILQQVFQINQRFKNKQTE